MADGRNVTIHLETSLGLIFRVDIQGPDLYKGHIDRTPLHCLALLTFCSSITMTLLEDFRL